MDESLTPEVFVVIGTRPEAIKMAPVVRALHETGSLRPVIVSTGQHRELLTSAFEPLGLEPEISLDVMRHGQHLNDLLSRVVREVGKTLAHRRPAAVLVQGDTTTVVGAAFAAFHDRVPVGHVEAGLRTYDLAHPFPEEANRQLVDRLADWCFAPTTRSAQNLIDEHMPEDRIMVVGNTAVDSLLTVVKEQGLAPDDEEDIVLVTLHRRESFGHPLNQILNGLGQFLESRPEVRVVWPVHPNPHVVRAASEFASGRPAVELCQPMDYHTFAATLARARVVLSDSGGVQEEAPSLGKQVLIARDTTERPEGLDAGNVLVGREPSTIRDALTRAWTNERKIPAWPAPNPFGDGKAGSRIARKLVEDLIGSRMLHELPSA